MSCVYLHSTFDYRKKVIGIQFSLMFRELLVPPKCAGWRTLPSSVRFASKARVQTNTLIQSREFELCWSTFLSIVQKQGTLKRVKYILLFPLIVLNHDAFISFTRDQKLVVLRIRIIHKAPINLWRKSKKWYVNWNLNTVRLVKPWYLTKLSLGQ